MIMNEINILYYYIRLRGVIYHLNLNNIFIIFLRSHMVFHRYELEHDMLLPTRSC